MGDCSTGSTPGTYLWRHVGDAVWCDDQLVGGGCAGGQGICTAVTVIALAPISSAVVTTAPVPASVTVYATPWAADTIAAAAAARFAAAVSVNYIRIAATVVVAVPPRRRQYGTHGVAVLRNAQPYGLASCGTGSIADRSGGGKQWQRGGFRQGQT